MLGAFSDEKNQRRFSKKSTHDFISFHAFSNLYSLQPLLLLKEILPLPSPSWIHTPRFFFPLSTFNFSFDVSVSRDPNQHGSVERCHSFFDMQHTHAQLIVFCLSGHNFTVLIVLEMLTIERNIEEKKPRKQCPWCCTLEKDTVAFFSHQRPPFCVAFLPSSFLLLLFTFVSGMLCVYVNHCGCRVAD